MKLVEKSMFWYGSKTKKALGIKDRKLGIFEVEKWGFPLILGHKILLTLKLIQLAFYAFTGQHSRGSN